MNFGTPQAGGKPLTLLLSSRFSDKVYMGPGQLYQDLQNLLHDLNVVGQISQLIGNLRGSYQVSGASRMGWCHGACRGACRGFQICEHSFVPQFSRMEQSQLGSSAVWALVAVLIMSTPGRL